MWLHNLFVLVLVLFIIAPVHAVGEFNPSVEQQPFFCRYSLTDWTPLCQTDAERGPQGEQGEQGLPNFSAVFYNVTNSTINQTNSTFVNVTDSIINSNYSVFEGGTYTNINESYAYLPGRAGGQTLTGGTTSGDLVLNGSANNGNVVLNPDMGGSVIIGNRSQWISSSQVNVVQGVGLAALRLESYSNTSSMGPATSFMRGGGDILNPVALVNGNRLGYLAWSGFDGSTLSATAQMIVAAEQEFTTTAQGTNYRWVTTALHTASRTEQMRLNANGTLLLGMTATNISSHGLDVLGQMRNRNIGAGTVTTDALGNFVAVSDEKLKTAIKPYTGSISKIMAIQPIEYKYNAASGLDTQNVYTGFSAQNLKIALPESVYTKEDVVYVQDVVKGKDGEDDTATTREVKTGTTTMSISDRAIIAALVNSVKEQQTQVQAQQDEIKRLNERLTAAGIK